MKRVATAVVLIALVLLLVFISSPWPFVGAISVLSFVATQEILRLIEKHGLVPLKKTAFVALAALLLFSLAGAISLPRERVVVLLPLAAGLCVFALFPIFVTLAMRAQDSRSGFPSSAATLGAISYVFLPVVCLMGLRLLPGSDSWLFLMYLFLTVWIGDIFAFYVGRAIGRHKLAPRVSPNKSWEGSVASVVGAVLIGWVWTHFAPSLSTHLVRLTVLASPLTSEEAKALFPPAAVIILTILVNISAQLGDLAESMIKRGADVKDSGTLLPGHGGVLDRIDALLFAAPIVWYYAYYRLVQGY